MKYRSLLLLVGVLLLIPACKKKKKSLSTLSGTYKVDQEASKVFFTSIKNKDIPVSGFFHSFSGHLSVPEKGKLSGTSGTIELDLSSLDTNNDERDQQILEFFFEAIGDNIVSKKVAFEISKMQFEQKKNGKKKQISRPLNVDSPENLVAVGQMKVHKSTNKENILLQVNRTSNDRFHVSTRAPLNFDINKYEMTKQLKNMMEVCGHDSVSETIAVHMNLVFEKAENGK